MVRTRNPELTAEIIRKASVGETKKRIAEDLDISQGTVREHLQAVKFKVDSRIEKGEDPFDAWVDILVSILIGAGVGVGILWLMKLFEEEHKRTEEQKKLSS